MKTRPILFSGPMVRSLLAGTKTQTRRIVKPAAADIVTLIGSDNRPSGEFGLVLDPRYLRLIQKTIRCPYGVPGDLLWVREAWRLHERFSDVARVVYQANARQSWSEMHEDFPVALAGQLGHSTGFKPSIHLPRWASRLTLEITDVRVERLASISREDAIAEGATSRPNPYGLGPAHDGWSMDWSRVGQPARDGRPMTERDIQLGDPPSAFANYINELHGGPNWNFYYNGDGRYQQPIFDANPWVWAVSFKVHQQNVDAFLRSREAA